MLLLLAVLDAATMLLTQAGRQQLLVLLFLLLSWTRQGCGASGGYPRHTATSWMLIDCMQPLVVLGLLLSVREGGWERGWKPHCLASPRHLPLPLPWLPSLPRPASRLASL